MTDLNNKFKDRNPIQTIEIIKNFFEERNCQLKVVISQQSEIGTWWCHLDIIFNNLCIGSSNGKGTTELYSLASGYAEAYERFCNLFYIYLSPFVNIEINNLNYAKNNCFFDKNEQVLNLKEIYNDQQFKPYFDHMFIDYEQTETYLNLITCGNPLGIPYQSFLNNEIKYYDPRLLAHLKGSKGLVAGNTIEEALNQGISELCENYVSEHFFTDNLDAYYILDNNIFNDNEIISSYIKKLEELNFKVNIIDLSYNYGIPVVALILIDLISHNTHINFGSFPILDIAVERTITEIYQGLRSQRQFEETNIQISEKYINVPLHLTFHLSSFTKLQFVPDNFFLKQVTNSSFNQNVFLREKILDNNTLNQYFIKLLKQKKLNIYYYNNSFIDDFICLHIVCPQFYTGMNAYNFEYMDHLARQKNIEYCEKYFAILMYTLQDHFDLAFETFMDFIQFKMNDISWNERYFDMLCCTDFINLYPFNEAYLSLIHILHECYTPKMHTDIKVHPGYLEAVSYILLLQNFLYRSKTYNKQDFQKIILSLSNTEVLDEEINNCYDIEYIFKKCYYEPTRTIIASDEYQQFLNLYIK